MDTIQTIDKLKEVMLPVAEKIGQTAQYGWEVVVKQQYITAYLGILWSVIGLIGVIISIYLYKWAIKDFKENKGKYDNGWQILVATIFTILSLTVIISGLTVALTHFLNPDYYAIQFFLDLVNNQ